MSMGTGFDGRGYGYSQVVQVPKPCRSGPWVPRESMRQGGDNPPCHVDSRFSTWQGGRIPPCRVDLFFDVAGREEWSCHVNSCVCGGGVKWGGERLGREGGS